MYVITIFDGEKNHAPAIFDYEDIAVHCFLDFIETTAKNNNYKVKNNYENIETFPEAFLYIERLYPFARVDNGYRSGDWTIQVFS